MSDISLFTAFVANTMISSSSQSLDTIMSQRLSSQPSGQVFKEVESEEAQRLRAKQEFLLRYLQAMERGEFILVYDAKDPDKMSDQFADDLALLYALMMPTENDDFGPPSMSEMENWLIALVGAKAEDETENETEDDKTSIPLPDADERKFLMLAFNNFQLVYKKNWENLFDKVKEEMIKPLTVNWDQPFAEPDWPTGSGEYTPTAVLTKGN